MRKLFKILMYPWGKRKKRKKKLEQLLKDTGITIVKRRDTSIVLGCFARKKYKNGTEDLYTENGDLFHKGVTDDEATELMAKYSNEAKAKGIPTKQYLDDLVEARKLRRSAYKKWITKFEQKFHKHFDGEIDTTYLPDGVTVSNERMVGAHNHEMIGINFDIGIIRDPLDEVFENLPRDIPFRANVSMVKNGKTYKKTATSSFFPLDWDITRVKEEIAFV